ncbi:MAG: iron-sulfur cluster-binding domain-containing protein, partial [Bacteroidetes bacterium]|nr:iron-sulfur cluster-binding domain-containing protein [Bacteroidota bacterium]
SPMLNEAATITVKRVDNGIYSRHLIDKAKVGDELYTTGAAGLFTLPANINDYEQVFFLAAGIGITPIFSLIKTLLYTNNHLKITLVYSNRTTEEAVFHTELQILAGRFAERFTIEYLYSTAFNLQRARLSKWLLPKLLQEYALADKSKMLFYLCGPFSYMRMVSWSLEEQGINTENIKRENFNTELRPSKILTPPDIAAHTVHLYLHGKQYDFVSQYPDTILQAAKKQGITLPYSCETGRCGSCAMLCTKGKVWLSYNEVLTDADIARGLTLSCTGYPVNDDVTLVL